ncbi:hypothetical protein Hamer_G005958 [Homarus americanus]|uniref:Uncharacterized protein n=1 Tax=Homarus americanus TaxID=6706 RepID=A0A8J5MM24_HOMAM|nr:hypothetical protein Hamer_G005958 [Homarus americanus]
MLPRLYSATKHNNINKPSLPASRSTPAPISTPASTSTPASGPPRRAYPSLQPTCCFDWSTSGSLDLWSTLGCCFQ